MKLIDLLVQELPKRGGWPALIEGIDLPLAGNELITSWKANTELNQFVSVTYGKETITREQYEAAIAAAQQPVWDGEGLPPVGVQAEVSVDGGRSWCSYKATRENNGIRLVEIGNFTEEFQEYNWMFRPIRTEADKKREIGVTALAKAGGAVDFEYDRRTIDGELSSPEWYELYDKIAAGEVAGIRIE